MIPSFGATEVLIFLVVVLLLFGAKRIPDLARSLGSGAREFREGISDKEYEGQEARDHEAREEVPVGDAAPDGAGKEDAYAGHVEQKL